MMTGAHPQHTCVMKYLFFIDLENVSDGMVENGSLRRKSSIKRLPLVGSSFVREKTLLIYYR